MGTPGSSAAQCSRRTRAFCPAQPSARATAQTAMAAAPAARKVDAASMHRAAGGHDVVDQHDVLPCHDTGISGKSPAQVARAFIARESDLRRRAAYPAQGRACEPQVQQARHDPCDFVRLVESPLDETRRVQGHGHDQVRASPWSAVFTRGLPDHARAEDPRIRQGAFVLECLHQLRHRKLVGPRGHASGVGQVERTAMRATASSPSWPSSPSSPSSPWRGKPQRRQGSGTSGISASHSTHRS